MHICVYRWWELRRLSFNWPLCWVALQLATMLNLPSSTLTTIVASNEEICLENKMLESWVPGCFFSQLYARLSTCMPTWIPSYHLSHCLCAYLPQNFFLQLRAYVKVLKNTQMQKKVTWDINHDFTFFQKKLRENNKNSIFYTLPNILND